MNLSIIKNIACIFTIIGLPGCGPDANNSTLDKGSNQAINSFPSTDKPNPTLITPTKPLDKVKRPIVDLSYITDPPTRKDSISAALSNSNPAETLEFLIQNQRVLLDQDIELASLWISQLGKLGKETLVDGVNKIRNASIRHLLFRSLSGKVALTQDLSELKNTANQFQDESARNGFLRVYMESAIQASPTEILINFDQLRNLNPNPGSSGWYNQLLADTARNLPLNKVDATWKTLPLIKDESTRTIAAQVLFGIRWEADSHEATTWLNSLEASSDKTSAVRSLVNQLEIEGDHESAEAWKKILTDKYK